MRSGRPLRFLAAVGAGWVGVRTLLLWPTPPIPALAAAEASPVTVVAASSPMASAPARSRAPRSPMSPSTPSARVAPDPAPAQTAEVGATETPTPIFTPAGGPDMPAIVALASSPSQTLVPIPPRPTRSPSRWSASVFAVVRGAGRDGGLSASQLGGSQLGARVAYALDGRVSVVARVASPLGRGAREGAVGVEWRPLDAPVRLFAEQRIGIADARGGPSVGVIAGLDERLPLRFRLEAYGQAGAIGRDGIEAFADGAMRATRPVATLARMRLDLGAGVWGAAQRGAERLDVGPTLGLAVPIGGRTVRVALDWRERVAGRSRPGSGPALSVGADF